MMLTPLQMPSVHHNPFCEGCACNAEKKKDNMKRNFGWKNAAKERLNIN